MFFCLPKQVFIGKLEGSRGLTAYIDYIIIYIFKRKSGEWQRPSFYPELFPSNLRVYRDLKFDDDVMTSKDFN